MTPNEKALSICGHNHNLHYDFDDYHGFPGLANELVGLGPLRHRDAEHVCSARDS